MTNFEPVTYSQPSNKKKQKILTIAISFATLILAIGAGFAGFKLYQLKQSKDNQQVAKKPQALPQEQTSPLPTVSPAISPTATPSALLSPSPTSTSSALSLQCKNLTVTGSLFTGQQAVFSCQHSGQNFSHYNYRYKSQTQNSWVNPQDWQEATASAQWQVPKQARGQSFIFQCQACNNQNQCTPWGEVKGIFTQNVSFFTSLTPNKIFALVIIAVWTVGTIIVAILTYKSRKKYKLAAALTIILTAVFLSISVYFAYNKFIKKSADPQQLPAEVSSSASPAPSVSSLPSPSASSTADPCTLKLTIPQKKLTTSPSPTPSPISSPSPIASLKPKQIPSPSPSPSPSLIAKIIPSPSTQATAPAKQLPDAGTTLPTLTILLGGIILITLGLLF